MDMVRSCRQELAHTHGRRPDEVISSERHALSMEISEKASVVGKPAVDFKDRIDDVLMHPIWGYVSLAVILIGFFVLVFKAGSLLEAPLVRGIQTVVGSVQLRLGSGFWGDLAVSGLSGIGSGVAVVLPYLVPFLMGLAILEDVGYLPRVAFLMDAFMHRIGLNGMAVIPAILGYGCNVPAVMATRILESPRDRFIGSIVSTIVPCSARMTLIMGLAGVYAGGLAAFGIYALNFIVAAAVGGIASRLMPEVTPGMMLEMPVYHMPRGRVVWFKTWLRLKEFIVVAWPLLIAGTAVLGLADHFGWTGPVNRLLSPLTRMLGLPIVVGMTLIFGLLRKELSMLMLFAALGTQNVASVMSVNQIMTFTVFVVFYVPCVATLGMLIRQIGLRRTGIVFVLLFVLALALALATRIVWRG
jgi:ferrous iron transport protein B